MYLIKQNPNDNFIKEDYILYLNSVRFLLKIFFGFLWTSAALKNRIFTDLILNAFQNYFMLYGFTDLTTHALIKLN